MNRQFRIYVNGKFQFPVTIDSDAHVEQVADRAAEAMKLSGVRPVITVGQINFVPA